MKKRYNMGGIPDDVRPGMPQRRNMSRMMSPTRRSYTPQTQMGSPPFVNQAGVPNANAKILQQQQMMIDQLKLNNQQLDIQNKLLNTQIELKNTINSARKVAKTKDAGAKFSPKKKGGVRSEQEERVGNKIIIASSNSSMRRGGQIK